MSKNIDQDKKEVKDKAQEISESGKKHASELYEENKDRAESIVNHVKDAASSLYNEGKNTVKDTASNLYKDGIQNLHTAEKYLGDTTDEVIKLIKEKPIASVLIAGGIGWLLSALLRK